MGLVTLSHQYVVALDVAVKSVLMVHERKGLENFSAHIRNMRFLEVDGGSERVCQ